jgi:hypothetical protein
MRRHEVLASGVVVGVAGAVAMMGVATFAAAWNGLGAMYALQVIGESLVGPRALESPAAQVAFGALLHLLTSVALGVVFAAIVPRDFPPASAIGVGVGFGLLALVVMTSLVVPWANPGFGPGIQAIGGSWVIAHAAFGGTIGMAPAFQRWLVRERAPGSASRADPVAPGAGSARGATVSR